MDELTDQPGPEDDLRRIRDQLAEAQRLARLGSWEWDIPANTVTWSDELYRIYGLEPGETEPSLEEFLARVHPDDRDSVDARNRKALADHEAFDDVKRCVRPDGTVFLMRTQGEVVADAAGQPIRMLGVCEDVTAEKEAERALAELASIVLFSQDAIVARTIEGRLTSWNPGATRLYGYSAEEAIGRNVRMLIPSPYVEDDEEKVARLVRGETVEHFETRRRRKDGSLIDVSLAMSPVLGADGSLIAISTIGRDITDRRRLELQLKRMASRDPLTGLMNRRRFEQELRNAVAHSGRYETGGAVLVLDLDNFKYVNDEVGHRAGDELLRSVALQLRLRLRRTDLLARLGGDEFAILLPHASQAAAREVATALLEGLREHVLPIDGRPISVTTSIGIACFDADGGTGDDLLEHADRAMYAAKDSGRDRAVSAAEHRNPAETRVSWEHRIREALEQELFVLHAQPILDLRTGEISQHELLLRMRDGNELIPPGAFLGVAERLGLIHAIDRWVIDQAMRLLAQRSDLRLEVNLSARSLDDQPVLQSIRDGLAEHGVDPSRLIFEITETAAIGNMDVARKLATALGELGCSLALDDFGAGFGSFHYLKQVPVEYLKIDGDFVRNPRSRTDELIIESIVRIAQGLGKRTIAESVEDAGTLGMLRDIGVDFAQGFHVGRPVPLAELAAGKLTRP